MKEVSIKKEQVLQEDQYLFPYHYIPSITNGDYQQVLSYNYGFRYVATLQFLIAKINKLKFNSICDMGTGDGRLVNELIKKYPSKKIYGIDYSERAINLATSLNPEANFINKNLINDSITEKFDILLLVEVLEHIPVELVPLFVRKMASIINDRGLLILTVPCNNYKVTKKHFQHFDSKILASYLGEDFELIEEIFIEDRNWQEKIISKLFINKLFMLNYKKLANFLYKYYYKNLFFTTSEKCARICQILKKR